MRRLNNKSLTLIVLCLVSLQYSVATPTVSHASLHFPGHGRIEFTPRYFSDEKLVYALCNKNNQTKEKNCTVVLRNLVNANNNYHACNITLKPEKNGGRIGPKIEIVPFGDDKAILTYTEWGKQHFIWISTIQFSTCKTNKMKLDLNEPFMVSFFYVVPYENVFDVIFENDATCGDKKCKITVDENGKNLTQIVSAFKDLSPIPTPPILPISKGSPSQGLFFMRSVSGDRYSKIFHVLTSDGTEKILAKYRIVSKMMITSATNNFIGVCYRDSSTANIKCTQHDAAGNLKMETILANSNRALGLRKLYNMPHGGFILLAVECPVRDKGCVSGKLHYFVMKVDSAGKKVGSFDIEGFQCNLFESEVSDSIYRDITGEYCTTLICREGQMYNINGNQRYINVTTNCFTAEDFIN